MILQVQGLTAGYGEGLVLSGLDLAVDDGEFVCLMGRNGAGKTTLLSTIMGLLPARAGRVVLGGQNLTSAPAHARARAGVGYVPQGRRLFPELTVLENLQVAADAVKARRPSIDGSLDLFPVLRTMLGKQAGSLSGGQQQQLAFARALVGRPRLLLLDEPTEGIQPSLIVEIEEALARLKEAREVAVLLVEQYLEFALRLADRALAMEGGRVVLEGTPEGLDRGALHGYLAV